jgi:hypothetical protein
MKQAHASQEHMTEAVWASSTNCRSVGDYLTLESSAFAPTLLLETLAAWLEAMLPYFTRKAQSQWGDAWERECAEFLSKDMKDKLSLGGGWDAYRLLSVMAIKPAIFMPNRDELSSCAKEIYRQVFAIAML